MPVLEDNLARLLRKSFGVQQQTPPENVNLSPSTDSLEDYDVTARMNELFQPRSGAGEKFEEVINRMPRRGDPGWHRRIVGGLIAANSPDRGQAYVERPYTNELDEWKASVENQYRNAQLEQDYNTQARGIAQNVIQNEMADRRLTRQLSRDRQLALQGNEAIRQRDETIAQGNERLVDTDERLRIANEQLKISQAIAKGGVLEVDDAGNAFIVGRDRTITPVDAEYLTAEQKNQLAIKRAQSTPSARDRVRDSVRWNPETEQFEQGVINLDTGIFTPTIVGPPPPAPPPRKDVDPNAPPPERVIPDTDTTSRNIRQFRINAMRLKSSNPKYAKWINLPSQENALPEITRPGAISGAVRGALGMGPTQQDYDEMNRLVFGSTGPARANTPPAASTGGRVAVIGPKGETGTVTAEDAKNLPPGWRVK